MNPMSTEIHVWRPTPWNIAQEIEVPVLCYFSHVSRGTTEPDDPPQALANRSLVIENTHYNSRLAFKAGTPITLTEDEWQRADANVMHAIKDRDPELNYV